MPTLQTFVLPTRRSCPGLAVVLVPRPTGCTPVPECRAEAGPRGLGGRREVGEGGCSAPDRPARRFSISGRNSKSQASHCTLIKPKRGQWKEKGGDGKNYPQRRRSGGRGKKESLGPAEPPGTEHCVLAHFSFPSPATPPSRAANRCPPKK